MVARIYNKLNTVLEQCVHPLHTVLEQCSKYFRTVNGAASWCSQNSSEQSCDRVLFYSISVRFSQFGVPRTVNGAVNCVFAKLSN